TNTVVRRNRSMTSAPHGCSAEGGGITSLGKLTIAASAVSGNTVELSSNAVCGDAHGGGILVHGSATISNTTVSHNRAAASSTVTDANAFAGGIADYGKPPARAPPTPRTPHRRANARRYRHRKPHLGRARD